MEPTQAQAPGQPQAPTPAHPIEQERADVEKFTQYVREHPDNDPEHPDNSSAPRPVETEAPAEAAPQEGEIDEDTPFFELDYKTENGVEKKKLNAKELREGYLAKQDYHRNIQKVKAQEAELQGKVQKAQSEAAQQYMQQLEVYKQAVIRTAAPELQNIDWNRLANEDPAEFVKASHRANQITQTLRAIDEQQRAAVQKAQQEQAQTFEQAKVKARETLEAKIPDWSPDLYNKILGDVAKEYGFKSEEVASVIDARLIEVFHDARKYRQLQQAKPEVNKRVVAVPKVVKPGSAEKANPASEAAQALESKLKKSGDWRDAAKLYLARQKQK